MNNSNSTETTDCLLKLIEQNRQFSCIMADPPWRYDQKPRGAAENHYPTMSLTELKKLPVAKLATSNAHLFLWSTHSFYSEARELMSQWGFQYKSVFLWVKPQMGMGFFFRSSAEFLLHGTRGRARFRDRSILNWACVQRGKHSEKPELFRNIVE